MENTIHTHGNEIKINREAREKKTNQQNTHTVKAMQSTNEVPCKHMLQLNHL